MTYDDGPWSYTSQLLDTLGSYGVKATFFLNGNGRGQGGFSDAAQPWGDLLKRMNSAGHQLASHTWSHQSLNAVDDSTRRSEMANNEQAFSDLLGFFPTYMRAPYLECAGDCQALLNELGYHIIDTNLDTKDYENDSPELIQVSKDRFSAGLSTDAGSNDYIVLSHDVHYQTVESLTAYMIELSIERGYKLVTVGECLGDPSSNWYRTADGSTGGSGGGSGTTNPPTDPPSTPSNPTTPTFTSIVKSDPKPTSEPSTSGLTVSPNARCGDDTGYTCVGSAYGDCCGFYGFWYVKQSKTQTKGRLLTFVHSGSTETYCGTGCRAGPGKCWTLGDGPTSNTDVPESKDTKPSTDGRCGASSGTTCEGYGSDHCCSSYGYW